MARHKFGYFAGRAQQALGLVAAHTQVWLVAGCSTVGAAKTGLGGLVVARHMLVAGCSTAGAAKTRLGDLVCSW